MAAKSLLFRTLTTFYLYCVGAREEAEGFIYLFSIGIVKNVLPNPCSQTKFYILVNEPRNSEGKSLVGQLVSESSQSPSENESLFRPSDPSASSLLNICLVNVE